MNNEEVRLECSPKLVKGHSEVNCAHPPLDGNRLQLLCVHACIYCMVLWSSCLATKFLISKYLATRRVVHGVRQLGQIMGLDRQAPLIEAHSTMHLMDPN